MKGCLSESDLLRLQVAEDFEFATERLHIKECPACTTRAKAFAQDTRRIADALSTLVADTRALRANQTERARDFKSALTIFRLPRRGFAFFTGVAVCGGATAFAVLLALGWRPSERQPQVMASAARASVMVAGEHAPRFSPIADPISAIAYDESGDSDVDSATSLSGSQAYGDPLFCAPGDDGSFCSDAGGHG